MDKETLSNYGWVVICVLVLVVMIALATPFGNYIATAVKNTTQGLDAAGITIDDNAFVEGNGGAGENGGAGQSPVIPEPPSNPETTFTFTIAESTYQAEEGMKWEKWVDSSYNTDGFAVFNSVISIERAYPHQQINLDYYTAVQPTDEIIPNHSYLFGMSFLAFPQ